ncbi:MAG: aldo/keto reductase [Nitrospirales bacterium]
MEYRLLGKTGLRTSVIGLGCSRLGASIFEHDTVENLSLLDYALDQGINFFDTADSYGFGNSELTLGKAFQKKRDKVILATKGGSLPSSLARFGKFIVPFIGPFRSQLRTKKSTLKKASHKRQNFDVAYLKKALENSLRRLKTDYIDLYQLHSPPHAILESEETFRFLDQCQQEGKIRFYGISINAIEDGALCLENQNIAALQMPINLLDQHATTELFPKTLQTGILARVPLARGLLTDALEVRTGPQREDYPPSYQKLKLLYDMCAQEERQLSDVAIQFLLQFKYISTILVGTKSRAHLRRNILAGKQPPLSQNLLCYIASLA